jgi:Cu-Zn family superoxide dismutase
MVFFITIMPLTVECRHGFHIHEKGDLGDGCKAAGGHFNPHGLEHGAPGLVTTRHVGDLGNVEAINGTVLINITAQLATLR